MIGALVVTFGQHQFSLYTDRWPMIIGAIYVVTILTAPDGFVGAWRRLSTRLTADKSEADTQQPESSQATGKEVEDLEKLQGQTEDSSAPSDLKRADA